MALKTVVASLEGIQEQHKALYVKVEADSALAKSEPKLVGQYVLDTEPVNGVAIEHVNGLKNSLSAARQERDEWKAKVQAYGDVLPEDAKKAATRIKELEAAKSIDATEQVENAKKQLQAKHAAELAEIKQTIAQRDAEVDQLVLDATIESALAASGAKNVTALKPFVRQNCKVVRGADGKPVGKIMQPDGKSPLLSKKAGNTNDMTIEEYVQTLREEADFSVFFDGTKASGTGAAAGAGVRGSKGGAGGAPASNGGGGDGGGGSDDGGTPSAVDRLREARRATSQV